MSKFNLINDYRGIALSGKAGSGKSTVANELEKMLDLNDISVLRVSFAGPLKDVMLQVLQSMGVLPYEPDPGWKIRHRQELQLIGTILRGYDRDIWSRIAEKWVRKSHAFVIIDDMRFPNELKMVKRNGLFTVRLNASEGIRASRIKLTNEEDSSETALDNVKSFDMVVDQDAESFTPEDIAQDILFDLQSRGERDANRLRL